MPGSGKLNTRCIFQAETKVDDGGGGFTVTWETQFTVWGGFDLPRLSARMEAIASGAVQTVNSGELIVRDASETRRITNTWRVIVTTDPTISPVEQQWWNVRGTQPRQNDGFIRMAVEAGVPN